MDYVLYLELRNYLREREREALELRRWSEARWKPNLGFFGRLVRLLFY